MIPKDASTIKARKTSTESAANPQTVRIATSEEKKASMEAGIRHVTPVASRPFFLDLCRSQTARLPMTINCIVDDSKMLRSL